ncbi:MAG: phosphate ABC transporter permease subunit PstC [Cytophagales bacterium]|nr:phosphate ABC transporter permease subunit PstC [Cytophagales bacterium]
MNLAKLKDKFFESVIYSTGIISIVIVLFIVYFLFKEGIGIFDKQPLEEGYCAVVHHYNHVNKISPEQIKKIVEGDLTNWKDLGGSYDSIYLFTLSDIEYKFTAEELGENFEHLNEKIAQYVSLNTGILAILPEKYVEKSLTRIKLDKVSLAGFFNGQDWYPASAPSPQFGALPILLGSLIVSIGAMLIAIPIGILVAIFLAELASPAVKNVMKSATELLSGIPSVVYGFFGIVVVVPFIKDLFNLNIGETALAGSVILAIIALPAIISLAEDAISSVPKELKIASLALGASHWQTIVRVMVPAASSGIISASILGIGRAFGETMAVLMVTGNAALMPTTFLQPVRTITATIAAELGEASTGGLHYQSLFILGSILFVITFIFNLSAELVAAKK